jgi:uncharacterized protein
MTWFRTLLAMLLLSLAALPAAAQPQLPPRPAGPVSDGANIIPDTDEQQLAARLAEYNRRTGRALVVATVPSLEGETIEQYAMRLYETWGIGGAQTDAGVLLLVAPNERKVRIEVGYGLHQYVTDILSGRIIRDQITPAFKRGDYAGGINAGIDALITQLDRDPADAKAIAEAAAAAAKQDRRQGGFPVGLFIWLGVTFFFFVLPMMARMRGGRRYHGGGMGSAVGNVVMWSALNAAMNSGRSSGGSDWGGFGGGGGGFGGGGGGGFGGFGGGMSGGGGASGSW